MEYRHELKFMASDAQLAGIRLRIASFMPKDEHQEGDSYTIRSLYFDTLDNACLRENADGSDRRTKYRIRVYGNAFDAMKLEKKMRLHMMAKKEFVPVERKECEAFLSGQAIRIAPELSDEKKRMFCEIRLRGMRPKSIVEYDRSAYTYRAGNVRVTFDRNIRGTQDVGSFFEKHIHARPLLFAGAHILEVKYDEMLPRFLYEALEIGTLQLTSFSKYCHSR